MAFTEITFVESDTAQEAYVDVDVDTGVIVGIYIGSDAAVLRDDHEDSERLRGLTWSKGQNPVYVHCDDVSRFLKYLVDEWNVTSNDLESWDRLVVSFPVLGW